MLDKPFISVIVPTYQCERFIPSAIVSVLNQTYRNFELIIVDDGSTDRTAEIIKTYTDNRIRYIYKENGGMSTARNYGIKKARGNYISWLDADDMFTPDILKTYVDILTEYPQIVFLYPNLAHIDEDSKLTGVVWSYKDYSLVELIASLFQGGRGCIPGIASTMARYDLYEKIGFFDEDRTCAPDYDFLTKFARLKIEKLRHVNESLYFYRQIPEGISHNLKKRNSDVVAIMKNMLKLYSFKELFPNIDLSRVPANKVAAEMNFHIGKVFLNQGILFLSSPHCNFYLREAESYLTKAINLNPNHDNCIANLGTLYLSLKNYTEALKYLSIVEKKYPGSREIKNNIGYAYYRTGNLDVAKKYLKDALLISPDFENAKMNLDNVEKDLAARDRISKETKSPSSLPSTHAPNDIQIQDNFNIIFHSREKYMNEDNAFRKALSTEPHNSENYLNLCKLWGTVLSKTPSDSTKKRDIVRVIQWISEHAADNDRKTLLTKNRKLRNNLLRQYHQIYQTSEVRILLHRPSNGAIKYLMESWCAILNHMGIKTDVINWSEKTQVKCKRFRPNVFITVADPSYISQLDMDYLKRYRKEFRLKI